jgi:hypothetical protein
MTIDNYPNRKCFLWQKRNLMEHVILAIGDVD